MKQFSSRKFLQFPVTQQHKKCAEMLRMAYDALFTGDAKREEIIAHYNQIQEWMQTPPLTLLDPVGISDRYHWHLQHAQVRHREHNLLPQVRRGDKAAQSADRHPGAIYLDNLRSAHNIGSILRTAEAFALGDIYFSSHTPFIDQKQVQDTSMGTSQWVSCRRGVPLQDLPRPLIALETSDEAVSLQDFIFPPLFTLAVGNEEYGCSPETLQAADILLEIPLLGRKNSLNVANAFAITAAEIRRQHAEKIQKGFS